MTDSGDGQKLRPKTSRWAALCREAVAIVKDRNFRASVVVFVFVLAWVASDMLVLYGDLSKTNLFGWIGIFANCLPWALAGMIPLWIFGRRSRLVYAILGSLAILLYFIQRFVFVNFSMKLTGSWVGMLALSSPGEMSEFVRQYGTDILVTCLLPAALVGVAFVFALSCVRHAAVTRLSLVSAAFSVVVFVYGTDSLYRGGDYRGFIATAKSHPSIYCIVDSVRNCILQRRLSRMAKSPALPETLHAADDREVVGVFVLGESATRNHWGLYGYPRDTTPQLSAIRDELAVFDDLVTASSSTGESMRGIFSTRTLESPWDVRYAMPQALAKCGFDVSLFSNQERWNSWGSDESFSFAGCDPFVVMKEQDAYASMKEDIGTNRYDEVLLPYLDGALAKRCQRQVVFLHLYGSHTPLEARCPPALAPFKADAAEASTGGRHALSVDDYDSSIWYTDRLLGDVVRKLKALVKPAWMVYLSDHGETPSAKSWRTATDPDLWEVPFVVWTSDSFDAAFPERVAALRRAQSRPLQSDQLLYGLLRFMGVEGLGVAPQEDFLNDAFAPRRPRLVQNGQAPYRGRAK